MSPFIKHRDKVLGHYGTAAWLRSVVMAMWNGSDHKVSLSNLTGLDHNHYTAFLEMVTGYREKGEGDPAFMALADEVRARQAEEHAAEAKQAQLDSWCGDVKYELRAIGCRSSEVDDYYDWFEHQFDAGIDPRDAAKAFASTHQ